MSENTKIKLKYYGCEFILDVVVNDYSTDNKSVDVSCVQAAKMVRQYIKQKFPKQFKSWVTSETFANGSAVNLYLSKFDGTKIDATIYEDVNSFAQSLRAGSFDGMTDSYNYNRGRTSDNGTLINMYTKYVSTYNKPKWDSPEYRMVNDD